MRGSPLSGAGLLCIAAAVAEDFSIGFSFIVHKFASIASDGCLTVSESKQTKRGDLSEEIWTTGSWSSGYVDIP